MCKLKDVGDPRKGVTLLRRRQNTTSDKNDNFDYYSHRYLVLTTHSACYFYLYTTRRIRSILSRFGLVDFTSHSLCCGLLRLDGHPDPVVVDLSLLEDRVPAKLLQLGMHPGVVD